ncbi:hypothetical protein V499_03952 [Pseudogymnoascus sp. VKM F-103]|nr:hypothetical protein V499_03952 [Pseudogymnoascus sp. VKM F-103]
MVELYAAFTVLSMDNGTRDAIIITLAGILANFFWHIARHSWRECCGDSGEDSYATELKLEHDKQRDISLKLGRELDEALKERDRALNERDRALSELDRTLKERDEARRDRNRYWDERHDYWKQVNEAQGERDDARKQRDKAYEERDKLRKEKLESDKKYEKVEPADFGKTPMSLGV